MPRPRKRKQKKHPEEHYPVIRDGEPTVMKLTRFKGEKVFRAEFFQACCGCGLKHMWTFEVEGETATLTLRAYRLPEADQ
jgi:hypothetical protein